MNMEVARRARWVREWIIFALCLGLGGHVVLGLMLHAPDRWPGIEAGRYGVLIGVSVYVGVQVFRSLWWVVRARSKPDGLPGTGEDDEL